MIATLVRIGWAFAISLALLSAAKAEIPVQVRGGTAAEVQEQADGSALHNASGLRFPQEAGSLRLGKLVVYGPGDASGTYYLSGRPNDTLLSFYIYPAKQSLDAEVQAVIYSIVEAWTATQIKPPVTLSLPTHARSGWYDLKNDQTSGRSVYVVARRGDWFIKARLTLAQDAGVAGLTLAQTAIASLPWVGPQQSVDSSQQVDLVSAPRSQ